LDNFELDLAAPDVLHAQVQQCEQHSNINNRISQNASMMCTTCTNAAPLAPDVLHTQVQQCQQHSHRLLLKPGDVQRQRQTVHISVEHLGQLLQARREAQQWKPFKKTV
jgi:hypothetical protein